MPVPALAEHLYGPGVRRGKEILFLCTLHDDHHPSLRVSPEKGFWWCPPCCVGGDVVTLASRESTTTGTAGAPPKQPRCS